MDAGTEQKESQTINQSNNFNYPEDLPRSGGDYIIDQYR